MKLAIVTAHAGSESLPRAVASWMDTADEFTNVIIEPGKDGMLPAYQRGFDKVSGYDVVGFCHDDLILSDPLWKQRVLTEFEKDSSVALVGFGGALGLGDSQLYKIPYDYHQLARHDFMSNMRDAESHGRRFTGACDVATLDGFGLFVSSSFFRFIGGWPLDTPINYINYDNWLACMVRRHAAKTRLVGISCDHLGGQTFVKLGIGRDSKYWDGYLESHEYLYEHFKDVLPFRVSA